VTQLGADVDAVEQLARTMRMSAERLGTLRGELSRSLLNAFWRGNHADAFRAAWRSNYVLGIQGAMNLLQGQAEELDRQARAQRTASEAGPSTARVLTTEDRARIMDGFNSYDSVQVQLDDPIDLAEQVMRDLAGGSEEEFRIMHVEGPPPRMLVILPGVTDLTRSGYAAAAGAVAGGALGAAYMGQDEWLGTEDNVRDGGYATVANGGGPNAYAEVVKDRVRDYMTANGLGSTTEVTLVGHSYGAMTAMDLAADPGFNGSTAKVTHVIAAGGGQVHELDRIPDGTRAMVMSNRFDVVSRGIDASHQFDRSRVDGDRLNYVFNDASPRADGGHHNERYATAIGNAKGQHHDFLTEAFSPFAGQTATFAQASTLASRS
jgi:pimeloyl-ACP methyl ester carboxylesterase